MNRVRIKKIVLCAVLADIAVVGSMFSFPILGSRCAPIQHMVNIICAVFLGPGYGVACAFLASPAAKPVWTGQRWRFRAV